MVRVRIWVRIRVSDPRWIASSAHPLSYWKLAVWTFTDYICVPLGSVVRRPDSAIHWIAIFSTFVKLAVDRYNLRLRFGI